jgi:hypothetical protein
MTEPYPFPATYYPSHDFNFNRGYVTEIALQHDGDWTIVWTDNVAVLTYQPFYVVLTLTINPKVFEWSSNVYSLDYVVERDFYIFPPDPVEHDMPIAVAWTVQPGHYRPLIAINPVNAGTNLYYHTLPPAPDDYWEH